MQTHPVEAQPGVPAGATTVFFIVALVLTFSLCIGQKLDIDEHGFIASGALMARQALLPYRDYHYNHMPMEVIVYAALFRMTNHLLLAARAFQALCAAGTATVVFFVARGAAIEFPPRNRLRFAWAIGLLLLTNQLFTATAARSWNHDFPLLLALLGFVALLRGLSRSHGARLTTLSGFFVGLAATSRLTFLPIVAPFGLFVLLYPGLTPRKRAALAVLFSLGFCVACVPSLWVWSKAWKNALFGNFVYPRLNTRIHSLQDKTPKYTFWPILWFYVSKSLALPTLGVLAMSFIILMSKRLRRPDLSDRRTWELMAVVATVLVLTATGFMPAPPYPQYIYATVPFMVLGIALALGAMKIGETGRWVVVVGWSFSVAVGASAFWRIGLIPRPHNWVPMKVHAIGVQVVRELPPGTVLTIEPLWVLEGGGRTDPRFAVGRFGLRVADLMSPQERRQYLMPGPAEMAEVFDEDAPGSVLVMAGSDLRVERSMSDEALKRGYRQITLPVGWGDKNAKHPLGLAWVAN